MMGEKRFQLNNNVAHNIGRIAAIIGLNLDYVSHLFIDNKNGRKHLTPHEIVDLLNSLSKENEQLKEQLQIIEIIIQSKITEIERDLQTSIKGGMPTGSLYSEIELLKKLKKECFDE